MSQQNETSSRTRIAKNTLFLYLRMLLLTLVSLYTSRVILDALGVEDYGVYNVVGGVVTMFVVLSGSLNAAITRFLNIEMGKGNDERLAQVFSSSLGIQFLIAAVVLLLGETVGLWFVNHILVIPPERLVAANWCYQFSLLTFGINLISVPYNSAIIAHEKMATFAYISIFEAVSRLSIALTIVFSPIDRLVYYAGLIALLSILVRFIYARYCKRHFEECRHNVSYDKTIFKQIFSFVGWNLIGTSSYVMREHGGTILTNLYFGPAVNAARALAMKVNATVVGFVQNFMVAMNPQITQNYASGNHAYMLNLVYLGSRFSFYILFLLSFPVMMCTGELLHLWLKEVPDYTTVFIQLILILSLSESLSNPLITAMLATGKIRNYQIVVGGIYLLNIPVSWLLIELGMGPEAVLLTAIVISQIGLFARLLMLRPMIHLSPRDYLRQVYLRVWLVVAAAIVLPLVLHAVVGGGIVLNLAIAAFAFVCSLASIYFVGCNQHEKRFLLDKCQQLKGKMLHV